MLFTCAFFPRLYEKHSKNAGFTTNICVIINNLYKLLTGYMIKYSLADINIGYKLLYIQQATCINNNINKKYEVGLLYSHAILIIA
jgi:hypothetical protein